MLGILDCRVGNINALISFYDENNTQIKIIRSISEITEDITKIILIGVSSFDTLMQSLNHYGFSNFLKEFVQDYNNKLLGICCGMQVLGTASEEGNAKGLGLINAENYLIKNEIKPHLGWNNITSFQGNGTSILSDISNKDYFYFMHSYYLKVKDQNAEVYNSKYNQYDFTSVVIKKNIYGVQFHPEKSHISGKKLLLNFKNL